MNNNSSQSRFAKITAKIIVLILAVVMAVSVIPELSADILPEANAATELLVSAAMSIDDINSKIANSADAVVNVKLAASIGGGLVIPSGKTVNLYLNGFRIEQGTETDKIIGSAMITNNGTLNVFSGTGPESPNASVASNERACIFVQNIILDKGNGTKEYAAYSYCEGINNSGVLNINKNVSIYVNSTVTFEKENGDGQSQVIVGAVGIVNNSKEAICNVNSAVITAYAEGRSTFDKVRRANSNGIAYGIYGGAVNISGDTVINATAPTASSRNTSGANKDSGTAWVIAVAYGVATDGNVKVTGGTINYSATLDANNACTNSDNDAKQILYGGGILVKTGVVPVVVDANINAPARNGLSYTEKSTKTYNEVTIGVTDNLPQSAKSLCEGLKEYNRDYVSYPTSAISAGKFVDELGNVYSASQSTAVNKHPANMYRGAFGDSTRVHIVYRYWNDADRTSLNTDIVTNDGIGFSYSPLTDGTDIVASEINLTGILGKNDLRAEINTEIEYPTETDGGGKVHNSNYWKLIDIAYVAGSDWYSDFSVTDNVGKVFKNFASAINVNQSVSVGDTPVYIFVDYMLLAPTEIGVKVGNANSATITYTGKNILPSEIGLQVTDVIRKLDYTAQYDIDCNGGDKLIDVEYSYTGVNAAGKEESATGHLPMNAGEYDVNVKIAASDTYDKDPEKSKNRTAVDYTFKLFIEQAAPARGKLPVSMDVEYGTRFQDALVFSNDVYAEGFGSDGKVNGNFSFANPTDVTTIKAVKNDTYKVVVNWSPAYSADARVKNYKETTFTVEFKVIKKKLTIAPLGATAEYGDSSIAFDVNIDGLIQEEDTEANLETLIRALKYEILQTTGKYAPYSAGTAIGEYYIRATFASFPKLLNNYEYQYIYGENNPVGVLVISQRSLIVKATAIDREYEAGNKFVDVAFEILDGKYGNVTLEFTNAQGRIDSDTVGEKSVSGITDLAALECLTGATAGNYKIGSLVFATGESLKVNITHATPALTAPVYRELNYMNGRALVNMAFTANNSNPSSAGVITEPVTDATASIPGTWSWVDPTVKPCVNTIIYQAKFTPAASYLDRYKETVVEVTIKVNPTPVVITYEQDVVYGDAIPNITAYKYIADLDNTFDINDVVTTGNLTPNTAYTAGSPVKAGGYAVTISATNFIDVNGNYVFTVRDGAITVVPKTITITAGDKYITYGDTFTANADTVTYSYDESQIVEKNDKGLANITKNGNTTPTFTFDTSYNYYNNYAAGEYDINIRRGNWVASDNYNVVLKSGTLFVARAPLTITVNNFTLTYGSAVPADLASAYTVTGLRKNDSFSDISKNVNVAVSTNYAQGKPVTAEGYDAYIVLAPDAFANYETTVEVGKVTVTKATPVITNAPTGTITYGQSLADATFEGAAIVGDVAGTFAYEMLTTVPAYSAQLNYSYYAIFTPADTTNYNIVRNIVAPLTVEKKAATGIVSIAGVPMNGKTLEVDVSGLVPADVNAYSFEWVNGAGTVVSTTEKYKVTENTGTLTVRATAKSPYETTNPIVSAPVVIASGYKDISDILTDENYSTYFDISGLTFGGKATVEYTGKQNEGITFSAKDGYDELIGNITLKFNGSSTPPVNAGTYDVTIDVSLPDHTAGAYSSINGFRIGTLEITRKAYVVNVTMNEKEYDGTVFGTATVTKDGSAIEGDIVSFNAASVVYKYDTANASVTNKVTPVYSDSLLKGPQAGNYTLVINVLNENITIKPRSFKVTAVAVDREYDAENNNVMVDFIVADDAYAAGDEDRIRIDLTNVVGEIIGSDNTVGTYRVSVEGAVLAGEEAVRNNYTLVITNSNSVTVNITPAKPVTSVPVLAPVTYSSTRTLEDIDLPSGWSWDPAIKDTVPGAGTHSFAAIYKPADTTNYATVTENITLTVEKAIVFISAVSYNLVYGDKVPTYTYTVSDENALIGVDGYAIPYCNYTLGSGVGEYLIELNGTFTSDNYDFRYVDGKVEVAKKDIFMNAVAVGREYAPGNVTVKVNFSIVDGKLANDDVSLNKTSVDGTIASDGAGIKLVELDYDKLPVLSGSKASNYNLNLTTQTVTVEIAKAVIPTVVLPVSGVVGFGQPLSSTSFDSNASDAGLGKFTMENPSSTIEQLGTFTDTYRVIFTPNDPYNYATITSVITVTVVPTELNRINATIVGTAQVGKTLYAATGNIPDSAAQYLKYAWYRVDNYDDNYRTGTKLNADTDSYVLTESESGKYIVCVITIKPDAPYTCDEVICVSENPVEEQQLTFWQKFVNWFYNIISNLTVLFGGAFG